MATRLLDSGNVHVITGSVDASTATLTSTDGAMTLTDSGTGFFTINFVHAFNSVPVVVGSLIKANSTTVISALEVTSISTTTAVIKTINYVQNAVNTVLADIDFSFIIIGSRNT